MIEIEEIEKLIALMKANGVMELAVEHGEFKVRLRRAAPEQTEEAPAQLETQIVINSVELAEEIPNAIGGKFEPTEPTVFTSPIIAPLVGVFHNGGMSERRKLLREGDIVKEGQIIGTIEAMKVPHELRSPVNGVIERILVEDGAGVEYGQTLMLLEPAENFGA